jgi:hypothetical protein
MMTDPSVRSPMAIVIENAVDRARRSRARRRHDDNQFRSKNRIEEREHVLGADRYTTVLYVFTLNVYTYVCHTTTAHYIQTDVDEYK